MPSKKRPLPKRRARPDYDRSMVEVLKAIKDLSPQDVSRLSKGGVAAETIRKWRLGWNNGGTRFPQAYTLNEAAKAIGGRFGFIAPTAKPYNVLVLSEKSVDRALNG